MNFYFVRDDSRFGNEMENRRGGFYCESVLGLRSKPEPFLQEPQKKFGTHASFNRAGAEHWCRAEGSPPAQRSDQKEGTAGYISA